MDNRSRSPGRPKGSPNKFTKEIKDAFQAAFASMQSGESNLLAWGEKNPTDFYRIVSKMLPQGIELTGEDGGPVQVQEVRWRVVSPK